MDKMYSLLNSPQLWAEPQLLLTEQIRCPVQVGRWLEFALHQLIALMC
jgi:hypothetical protein